MWVEHCYGRGTGVATKEGVPKDRTGLEANLRATYYLG